MTMGGDTEQLLTSNREEILRIAAKHGARNVRVFGSFARGEARLDSDVDFLVEMEPSRSLFDLAHMMLDLQDLLGRKVDVVEAEAVHWYIRDQVLNEAVPVLTTSVAAESSVNVPELWLNVPVNVTDEPL